VSSYANAVATVRRAAHDLTLCNVEQRQRIAAELRVAADVIERHGRDDDNDDRRNYNNEAPYGQG
jgi:hypothetical protein